MFVRFRQIGNRLRVSLLESHRSGAKVRHEHVASLGSVVCVPSMTIAGRIEFWRRLHERLAKLSNRIGADEQGKILGSIHARIPMVTIDEIRTLQRENAEADEKFWAALQGMNAEQAEGHKELAAKSARIAADAEAGAAAAAGKASVAKDRIEHLAKGEDVSGGLGKPLTSEDYEKILRDAGWTAADIRFSKEFHHSLRSEEEFQDFVQQSCEIMHRAEQSRRWKILRQIRAKRGRDA